MVVGLYNLFRYLKNCNRDPAFVEQRQKNLFTILIVSTLITVTLVMVFHVLDYIIHLEDAQLQLKVRGVFSTLFLINMAFALRFRKPKVTRFLLYNGFLLCAFCTTVQSITTGGLDSPYWFGINVVMIVWFIFIPIGYRNHILFAAVFVVQYFVILLLVDHRLISTNELAVQLFSVGGVFFIGVFVSIINNRNAALIFYNQHALIASEQKYRNLVEHATDGIIITKDGKFVFANQTFIDMTGYTWEELQEKNIFDLVAPEDHPRITDTHIRRMKGDTFRDVYTITGLDKFGQHLPMELNSSTIDYFGQPAAFIIVRDYTQQFKAQQALKESEERYRTIFNMVGDAILIMRYETGKILDVNEAACKVYGYTREEFLKLSNPDVSAEPEKSMQVLRDNKGPVYIPERKHKRKDGSILNVEIIGNVFRHNDEDMAISVVHDYTDKKRLEQELEKSYAILEQNYSHTLEQMQTYFSELQSKKSELLRVQKENLQSQFETLKNQVNPHFLFNSLNVLSSLISVDPEMAETFTGNLSKIYRYVLEHRSDDLVTLQSELDFLQAYTYLLNTRFKDKLHFNINIPGPCLSAKLPPLAIQILIENVIKHNTFSKRSPLSIDIFVGDNNELIITNNYQPRENKIESTGLGLSNITNRYSYFTDRPTSFQVKGGMFEAKIPLL